METTHECIASGPGLEVPREKWFVIDLASDAPGRYTSARHGTRGVRPDLAAAAESAPVPEIIDPQYNYDLGPGGASYPILLTDGSVIIQNENGCCADGKIFKLTPDINGSY